MTITVKRAEGIVEFCTDLGLRAEWEQAAENLESVTKDANNNMLVDTAVSEAVQTVKGLEARMSASTLLFRVQALRRGQWEDIGAQNPPRAEHAGDKALGVDTSKFFDDIAIASIFAVTEKDTGKPVDFDPATEWVPLADEMTNGQYSDFVAKFRELNQGATHVPFSRAASVLTRISAESSTSPTSSGSAAND